MPARRTESVAGARRLARATAALAAALALAATAIHTGAWAADRTGSDQPTVEQIFGRPSIYHKVPTHVTWLGNSRGISCLADVDAGDSTRSALVVREVPSGKQRVLVYPDTVTVPDDLREDGSTSGFSIGAHHWDRDGRTALFTFGGDVFTLDARNGRIARRTHTDGEEKDASFSPDGRKIAYTRDHDLYVMDLGSNEEIRLTTTGSDSVLNGVLDWVYMEELFTRGNVQAYKWSPDGRRLAFLEIREAPVPTFPIVDNIPVDPTYRFQHYPKAGDPNPIVRVGIVPVDGGEVVWSDIDTSDDSYIARAYWLGDSRAVAIQKLNRAQTDLSLYFADAGTGATELELDETADTWVNVTYLHHYYEKKRQFIWGSERDGHSHLYLYNLDGSLIRQVTSGPWEVTDLCGVDERHGKIYFEANEKSVLESHLYSIDENGENLRRITTDEGTHDVTLSPDFKYFIDKYSSDVRPTRTAVYTIKGKKLFEVGDEMSDRLKALARPTPEFFTIDHDGRTYHCMMTKPLDFDASRKYPVIVYVYGGPGAQVVKKSWSRNNLWHGLMAQRGFIVFSLDNRGATGYGKAWEEWLLKDMGRYELEDQMAGVDYLKSLPYVDADNIGIWGWSYGGYMTLMALFKEPGVFKAGTAVAPVSDWHLYDSIYTERYMKRPQDNPDGYESGSPLNFVDGYKGNLLLMQGNGDDNVHFQNSVKLVKELIEAGRDFDLMMYPGKEHSIRGTADRVFLYNKMTKFFQRHLQHAPPPSP